MVFTLSLASGRLFANPVLADDDSIGNGAELYELYCSECHGRDPASRFDDLYETDDTDQAEDDAELIAIVQGEETAQAVPAPEKEKWPEWAERPDPNEEQKPDTRMEVLNAVTAAMDEAHGLSSNQPDNSDDTSEESSPGGFEPAPGVNNLADPTGYFYGTSEDDVFHSIAEGTGSAMPGWRDELGSDEAIWDLVNYIRSFWDEDWRY